MSFIGAVKQGKKYHPGYFLVHEECVRKTQEMTQNIATTTDDGAKYVPMGTVWPANDGTAKGIVYEDVDVTNGNMPGSVVMRGVVYEDRLPVTDADYDSVTLKDLVSPKKQGWQERSGEGTELSPYTYANSTDTTVNTSKTYYVNNESHTAVSDYAAVLNPKTEGWYESDGGSGYEPSADTEGDKTKTYYTKTDIRITSAARSALIALGFAFVDEPTITRPDFGTNP